MIVQRIEVGNKKTIEYVAESVARFNRGVDTLILRGFAGSIAKVARVAQIIQDHLDRVRIKNTTFRQTELNGYKVPCLEIEINCPAPLKQGTQNIYKVIGPELTNRAGVCYVDFLIYNTLIDSLLKSVEKIHIKGMLSNKKFTCELKYTDSDYSCRFIMSDSTTKSSTNSGQLLKKRSLEDELTNVYYRAGLLVPPEWKKVAEELAQSDDIIVGVDTNILLHASLTEHFLYYSYLINPRHYIHTPNWMLVVIPKAVMHELEQATNARKHDGELSHKGRIGFRAIGEILQLENCMDITGVSLSIFGTSSPGQDVRVELKAIRQDLQNSGVLKNSPKSSTGDTIIRDEFTMFLQHINFHKGGAYFLTSDKTNAVLGRAEGLQSIYYKMPTRYLWDKPCSPQKLEKMLSHDVDDIRIPVPVGKLIYEFAVQFGEITLEWPEETKLKSVTISSDPKGKRIDPWLNKQLLFEIEGMEGLLEKVNSKFALEKLKNVNEELSQVLLKDVI